MFFDDFIVILCLKRSKFECSSFSGIFHKTQNFFKITFQGNGRIFWVGGGRCAFFMGEWRSVGGGGWTFFMGGWGWVEVYLRWVGVGGHYLWVGGGIYWGRIGVVIRFRITHIFIKKSCFITHTK